MINVFVNKIIAKNLKTTRKVKKIISSLENRVDYYLDASFMASGNLLMIVNSKAEKRGNEVTPKSSNCTYP